MISSGQTIAGKYRINQLLGSGGMASVWSATNIFTERQFAIKFMLPAVARTPEAARRFLMEAKVSARVNHANIIEIIDVGQTEEGSLFLVMELLTGVSLETAMRRQSPPMTVAEFLSVMLQVARALAAAHKNGVIHRDLKPTNIFLHKDREGAAVPKLLDFGVSKFLEEDGIHSLTIAGTVLGSPLYMSPEQAMGATVDSRTDAFAFGAIMFEGLCGFRAYDAPNFNALIVMIATTQPKKIDECAPKLPEVLRKLVRECMITEKEKRTQTFDEIAERLAAAMPEIERSGMALPLPMRQIGEPLSDPDATNALPVVRGRNVSDNPPSGSSRTSNKPPPPAAGSDPQPPSQPRTSGSSSASSPSNQAQAQGPRSGNHPASGYSAPWATPTGGASGSSEIDEKTHSDDRGGGTKPRLAYFAGAGLFGMVVAAMVVGLIRGASGDPHAVVASAPDTANVGAVIELPEAPSAAPTGSVPVISIDSLPVSPSAIPEHGTGRIYVGSSPGSCTVSIDGARRGTTPLPPVDLSPGLHVIRCDAPNGKTKTDSIYIREGATARHRFALD
jgi:serine/threonine-protein kinase